MSSNFYFHQAGYGSAKGDLAKQLEAIAKGLHALSQEIAAIKTEIDRLKR